MQQDHTEGHGHIAVIGGGSWGTTVAHLSAHNAPTQLYTRRPEVAASINDQHENSRYLPGLALHESLRATTDLATAVAGARAVVMGVPSHGFRDTLAAIEPSVTVGVPIVSLAKGLEAGTGRRMTEVITDVLADHPVAALSGPNLAKEILDGSAAASVLACQNADVARSLQEVLSTGMFRVYTNRDVVGAELGGALKNVIAIAAGMADGLGAGDNTRAAVITRGLAELTRLGVAMGGEAATFAGLAGMGDLIATCMSPQSRNRTVGEKLGRGQSIEQIIDEMQQVAEGVKSAATVVALGAAHGVELPICEEVRAVVDEGRTAIEAYRGLLARPQQAE